MHTHCNLLFYAHLLNLNICKHSPVPLAHDKLCRWFLVEASLPTKLHYLYVLLCVHFLHFQYTTNTELYTLHSTDVTLGDNQCCFSEANVTTTSCNVTVSGLSLSTMGMHNISLMLKQTDHNLVCNQNFTVFSEFIMIGCRIQWNLSIVDTTGTQLAVLYTVEPLYSGHYWDPASRPV